MAATIEPRQEALAQLYFEIFRKVESLQEEPNAEHATSEIERLSDEAVIARMLGSANADEIEALLNGDTSAYGCDESAADLALCNHLAFWTGKNRQQMDRQFRQSKLMRQKWDEKRGRQTYGEMTIDKACAGTSKVYEPPEEAHEPTYEDYNPALTRERADEIEAATGVHIYNAEDDPKAPPENSISEEELEAFKLPDGPKFECRLPKDHFLQRFIAYGTDISDAYPDYWLAGGLYALAVVADKKIKVVLKQGTYYPNIYVSINGKSSLARKSTAVDKTEIIIFKTLPQMLSAMVPTEFSPEAFIEHLSNFQHAPWIRDEAAGVLSLMKKDYMRGFKDSLMQLFDCKPFHRKLRTSQRKGSQTDFNVDDPYLNLLWATTGASLGANTDQTDTLSGFLARFIFFFPQGMKPRFMPLEEGTAEISMFEDLIVAQLQGIATKMSEIPECATLHISPEATAYYNRWQETREREWTATDDGAAMQIFSRLNPMVVKFGMIFELGSSDFNPAKPIRLEFIEEACRLVDDYLMPTARAVYDLVGANADKNAIDKIIAFLKQHNGKGSKREIMQYVKIKSDDFRDYVNTMVESELVDVKMVNRNGKGRNSLYLFLRDNAKVSKVSKVNKIANVSNVEKIPSQNVPGNLINVGNDGIIGNVANIGYNAQEPVGEETTRDNPETLPETKTIEADLLRAEEQRNAEEEHFRKVAVEHTGGSLKAIYKPKKDALEYAYFGLNLFVGCSHKCEYCYNKGRFNGSCADPIKKATLENIEADLKDLEGNQDQVHLCFVGDPYDLGRQDNSHVRAVLQLFRKYNHPFQVLTKGGTKAVQDFDLYGPNDRFGVTLTFINGADSKMWEPGAALPADRIEALRQAHERGIKTWASLEPVIDPAQTLALIEATHEFVDHYGVGKMNHNPEIEKNIDWPKFRGDAEALLKRYGKSYRIKAALAEASKSGGQKLNIPKDGKKPEDPGLQKFKAGMKKRHCIMCGRTFSYDLGIHYKDGYICQACQSGNGPEETAKLSPQKTLKTDGVDSECANLGLKGWRPVNKYAP